MFGTSLDGGLMSCVFISETNRSIYNNLKCIQIITFSFSRSSIRWKWYFLRSFFLYFYSNCRSDTVPARPSGTSISNTTCLHLTWYVRPIFRPGIEQEETRLLPRLFPGLSTIHCSQFESARLTIYLYAQWIYCSYYYLEWHSSLHTFCRGISGVKRRMRYGAKAVLFRRKWITWCLTCWNRFDPKWRSIIAGRRQSRQPTNRTTNIERNLVRHCLIKSLSIKCEICIRGFKINWSFNVIIQWNDKESRFFSEMIIKFRYFYRRLSVDIQKCFQLFNQHWPLIVWWCPRELSSFIYFSLNCCRIFQWKWWKLTMLLWLQLPLLLLLSQPYKNRKNMVRFCAVLLLNNYLFI